MSLSTISPEKGEAETAQELVLRGAVGTTVISRFELLSGAKSAKQLARLVQLLGAVDDAAADARFA
jgi:predicted nucleic acid-binding protein